MNERYKIQTKSRNSSSRLGTIMVASNKRSNLMNNKFLHYEKRSQMDESPPDHLILMQNARKLVMSFSVRISTSGGRLFFNFTQNYKNNFASSSISHFLIIYKTYKILSTNTSHFMPFLYKINVVALTSFFCFHLKFRKYETRKQFLQDTVNSS